MKIAIISTFYNRKEKTLACINSIFKQQYLKDNREVTVDLYFCDDGSTDGTYEEIINKYPQVNLIKGTGSLYWAKGMSKALNQAIQKEYNFFLMVNDDVEFYDNMLETMIDSYYKTHRPEYLSAIVGSTQDKFSGEWTYGGQLWNKKFRHEKYEPVLPASPCCECNMTNWNCFLIPSEMLEKIGKIDSYYEHAKADNDYSNRIINSGNKIYVAHSYIGTCQRNSLIGTWRDTSLALSKRLELVKMPNGLPIKSEVYYCKKFHGKLWFIWVVKRYLWIYISWLKYKVRNQ